MNYATVGRIPVGRLNMRLPWVCLCKVAALKLSVLSQAVDFESYARKLDCLVLLEIYQLTKA
jgi:hypothetical protein